MLDYTQDWINFHPSIMSFRRKWVSDTNLSKLLHETIEKKQANKQRKLPDFCKDAILSATIKKISSAMVIDKNLPCCGKDEQCLECGNKNDDQNLFFPDPDLLDKDVWENATETPMTINFDNLSMENMDTGTDILINEGCNNGTQWRTNRPPLQRQSPCSSPKRKRHPSSEGTDGICLTNLDTVSPNASPCKKRRESSARSVNGIYTPETDDFSRLSLDSWSEEDAALRHSSRGRSPNIHIKEQRSRSLPHLTSFLSKDSLLLASETNFPSPKSVVNSISELSLHDCWEPATEGSWCYPKNENGETDPLELNGFFQELKSVTVNPN